MDLDKFQDAFTWEIEQWSGTIIRRKDNPDLKSIKYIKNFYLLFNDRIMSKIKIDDGASPFFYWEVFGDLTEGMKKERVILFFGSKGNEEKFLLKIDSDFFNI